MVKTNEYVKATGSTMFFPRIIVTREEMGRLCNTYQITPAWIRMVVKNCDKFPDLLNRKLQPGMKAKQYESLVTLWSKRPKEVAEIVKQFANGELDIIDMVVLYGIHYKQCRKFVKDVFAHAGYVMDVDFYWKQHKKYAQKRTTVSLYGVEHTALLPEVQEKRRETNQRIYGADNPMQNPEIKEKLRKRILKEHGVEYTFMKRSIIPVWQNKLFRCLSSDPDWSRILQTVCERANAPYQPDMFEAVLPVSRRDFVISELHNTHVEDLLRLWVCETGEPLRYPDNALFRLPFAFSKTWLRFYERMGLVTVPKIYYSSLSIYEKHMECFLDSLSVSYFRNHKKALDGLEMDFYIPKKQIGIELNPNISHNSNLYATEPKRSMFTSHKESSYHYHKYRLAANAGITLIQLFGNDLEPSVFEHITSKRLKSLLCGYDAIYYARNVIVRELVSDKEKQMARNYMDEYHLQGSSRATDYWVFEQDGKWLGAASFSNHKKEHAMELKRLCFIPGIQVVGGLSKLIRHYFRLHSDCFQIYSYSDNSIGNGEGYRKAGAAFVKETGPSLKFISPSDGRDSYSWQIATSWGADKGVVGADAEQKNIQKPQTQDEINAYIEKELTHRLDDLKGYDRIYTPGSKLWVFTR